MRASAGRWFLVAALVAIWALSPVAAQEYRGNVFVTVQKEDGSPMSGAVVILTSGAYSRTFTTGADGKVRFVLLEPGSYTLKVDSEGYASVVNEGVEVNTSASTTLNVRLSPVQKMEESVVVTGQTPLLDQRKMGTATVLTQTELSEIPTSRDPWAVLSTVPGITTDRVNVAGNESGQQSNFVGKGDDGTNTQWWIDGVEFTDIGAAGSSSTYLDFNSFQEIGFVTGGGDVERGGGGATLAFTTKQGSNDIKGDARMWFTYQPFQSAVEGLEQPDNVVIAEPDLPFVGTNLTPNNHINEVFEKNFDLGGPIKKDSAWYWFGFSQNDIDNQIEQCSDVTGACVGTSDKTKLRNTSVKLNGQVASSFNWKAFYTNGDKTKDGRGAAPTRPPETTWDQKGPTPIYTGDFSYFFTPNFQIEAQYAHVDGKFSLTPKGGLDAQIINDFDNVWHGSYLLYDTVRPQDQYTVKGSNYFDTGSWNHELKYGFRYKKSTVESLSQWSNFDFFVYSGAYIYLYRERRFSVDLEHKSAWVGDTILHGNWAITAGVLWTDQSGNNNPSVIRDDGLCPTCLPGLSYPGSDSVFSWTDISPRIGATYTFNMDHRLLLRANYARYVDGLGATDIFYDNPAAGYIYITQPWTDDGDGVVEAGEFSTDCLDAVNSSVDPCAPNDFHDVIDPDYSAPRTDELIVGAEWELAKDFTVGANLIWRRRTNDRWYEGNLDGRPVGSQGPLYNILQGGFDPLTVDDYDCSTVLTGTFPDGTPYSEPVCDLNASGLAKSDGVSTILTNRPDYEQRYNGVELTATKRLSNKWMMRGFVSFNDWTQHFDGTGGISNPTNFQGGTAEQDGDIAVPSVGSGTKDGVWLGTSKWQANINGLYQLPWDMTISGNLYGRQGYGIPYIDRDTSVTYSSDVQIGEITDVRYDDLWTFDMRLGKLIKLQGATVELSVELFNAFNENTILSVKPRVDQPTNVNAITENLSPRIFRLGASITF
jgi:hypothetical protein